MDDRDERSLTSLSEATGVPPRTIRFYIARGVVPPPRTVGRAATYGREHTVALRRIKALQSEGFTLAEIGLRLGTDAPSGRSIEPQSVWRYGVAPDVTVEVRAGSSPWRTRQITRALEAFAQQLGVEGEDDDAED